MHAFPHRYVTTANGGPGGSVRVSAAGLPDLATAAPAEFGGPGDHWSPETLLSASVANCFILTFRALAGPASLEWTSLDCRVEAVLERVERVLRFTQFVTHAKLVIPAATDADKARELLAKAEERCLVANSLNGARHLEAEVVRAG